MINNWRVGIANFDAELTLKRDERGSWWSADEFPEDGVALLLIALSRGIITDHWALRPEPRFPLRLSDWRQLDPGRPSHRFTALAANGHPFEFLAWLGAEASADDRRALARVVESIRFPRLIQGTLTPGRPSYFRVLAKPSAYPPRSATWLETGRLPRRFDRVYLVRAPRGFYGLSTDVCRRPRFHREPFEFSCAGVRWDRTGEVVVARRVYDDWLCGSRARTCSPPSQQPPDRRLLTMSRHDVKLAHDGHLLVAGHANAAGAAVRRFWSRR